jgi:probable rRNA maturation factor
MNRVAVSVRDIPEPVWTARAAAFAGAVLSWRGIVDWELSLLFCDDAFIRSLNFEYRGKDEPTDVLSFSLGERTVDENGASLYLAGDIVISLPALARNAADFFVGEDEELRRLIAHGILHLSGLDHEDNEPSQPMLAVQETILRALGEEKIL